MMYQSGIINSYYTFNTFYFTFADRELVMSSVLRQFTTEEQTTIYEDKTYGMGAQSTLGTWVLATVNGEESE